MAATEHIPSTNGKFQKVIGLLQDSEGTDISNDNPLPVIPSDNFGNINGFETIEQTKLLTNILKELKKQTIILELMSDNKINDEEVN